jgi:hypothetical protein
MNRRRNKLVVVYFLYAVFVQMSVSILCGPRYLVQMDHVKCIVWAGVVQDID